MMALAIEKSPVIIQEISNVSVEANMRQEIVFKIDFLWCSFEGLIILSKNI